MRSICIMIPSRNRSWSRIAGMNIDRSSGRYLSVKLVVAIAARLDEKKQQHQEADDEDDHRSVIGGAEGIGQRDPRGHHGPVGRRVESSAPSIGSSHLASIEVHQGSRAFARGKAARVQPTPAGRRLAIRCCGFLPTLRCHCLRPPERPVCCNEWALSKGAK